MKLRFLATQRPHPVRSYARCNVPNLAQIVAHQSDSPVLTLTIQNWPQCELVPNEAARIELYLNKKRNVPSLLGVTQENTATYRVVLLVFTMSKLSKETTRFGSFKSKFGRAALWLVRKSVGVRNLVAINLSVHFWTEMNLEISGEYMLVSADRVNTNGRQIASR